MPSKGSRKVTTVETKELPPEEEQTPVDPDEVERQRQDDALQVIADSLGVDAARAKIFKADEYGQFSFHGSCPPSIISEEYLQRTFGGGHYNVKFVNNKSQYLTAKVIDVADPPREDEPEPVPVDDSSTPYQMELERMRDESRRQHELTLELIRQLGNREPPEQTKLTDIIAAMAALKEQSQPSQNSPVAQLTELVGLFKAGVELGASGGMPDKSWIDHLKDGAKYLPEVIGVLKANAGSGGGAAQPAPDPRIPVILAFINYLKPKALANKDSGLYVDLAMDNIEDPKWAPLLQLMNTPYDEIAKLDAELLQPQYRHWFESLFNTLKQEITQRYGPEQAVSDEDDSSRATGDEGKPA